MKPVISPVNDAVLQKNFSSLREVLCGGLSLDNMNFRVLSGTTAPEPDSQSKIIHSMNPRPIAWFPLVGDVYIQEISDKFIDVRSTKPGVAFQIIALGGAPVTGESLVAPGSASYKTTTQVIQQTPVIEVTEINDATITIKPTIVRVTTSQIVAAGNGTVTFHSHIVNDVDYFYVTCSVGNIANLVRVSKSTGVVSTITLGAIQLGPMYFVGTDLYVSSGLWDGVNTLNVYRIDTTTFTSSATIAISALTRLENCSDIYVDGSNIYVTGGNNTAGSSAIMVRGGLVSGAGTILTVQASGGANRVSGKLIDDGTNFWVAVRDIAGTATGAIVKINKAAFTVTTVTSIAGTTASVRNMRLVNGIVYAASARSGQLAADQGSYAYFMNALDTNTGTLNQYPLIGVGGVSSGLNQPLMLMNNLVELDEFLYTIFNSDSGCMINRFDTVDNTQILGWFPFAVGSHSGFNGSLGATLNIDELTGNLIAIGQQGSTNQVRHFEYFAPDFSSLA